MANPFVKQGKAIPTDVRGEIVERWLNGTSQLQISRDLKVPKSTIWGIIDNFSKRGHYEKMSGGNKMRTVCTDDVVIYTEYCKQRRPSASAREIQQKLIDNQVCLAQNVPSVSSISRSLREDLGYSLKRLTVVPRESLTNQCNLRLIEY